MIIIAVRLCFMHLFLTDSLLERSQPQILFGNSDYQITCHGILLFFSLMNSVNIELLQRVLYSIRSTTIRHFVILTFIESIDLE